MALIYLLTLGQLLAAGLGLERVCTMPGRSS